MRGTHHYQTSSLDYVCKLLETKFEMGLRERLLLVLLPVHFCVQL